VGHCSIETVVECFSVAGRAMRCALTGQAGRTATTKATDNGGYSFTNLSIGQYSISASAPKLEQQPVSITLKPGIQTLRLALKVAATQQQTTVRADADSGVSTESSNNCFSACFEG
jgi:hypothetical protein